MLRAVLDVNVLVSALLSREGSPARALTAWAEGAFELVVSPQLLAELARVTGEKRLGTLDPAIGHELAAELASDAILVHDPPPERRVPEDPGDDYLVALALAAGADVIVTGDRHLLDADLGDGAPRVLAPAGFLALVERLGV